jgi:hypothetical protein
VWPRIAPAHGGAPKMTDLIVETEASSLPPQTAPGTRGFRSSKRRYDLPLLMSIKHREADKEEKA